MFSNRSLIRTWIPAPPGESPTARISVLRSTNLYPGPNGCTQLVVKSAQAQRAMGEKIRNPISLHKVGQFYWGTRYRSKFPRAYSRTTHTAKKPQVILEMTFETRRRPGAGSAWSPPRKPSREFLKLKPFVEICRLHRSNFKLQAALISLIGFPFQNLFQFSSDAKVWECIRSIYRVPRKWSISC